jgi:HSP20 family protein
MVLTAAEPRQMGDYWQDLRQRMILAQTSWRPPADVVETDETYRVTIELAGIDPEQTELLLYEDALVVTGERRIEKPNGSVYHAAAIRQGTFRYELTLPGEVDPENVAANYERGLLQITLNKVSTGQEQ